MGNFPAGINSAVLHVVLSNALTVGCLFFVDYKFHDPKFREMSLLPNQHLLFF